MSGSIRLTGQMGVGMGAGLRYPGAYVALDFQKNIYEIGGRKRALSAISLTRASTGTIFNGADQLLTVASGAARVSDLGMLIEETRTNVALYCRDLTNAAWVKTNCTPALDQTGIDGVANSASSLTATGANATCLQAITLASSVRAQDVFIKRLTGSGTIQMTMDNGSTWTTVTTTAAYTRVTIPGQTLANPTVGFRIVTSGDAIAVDYFKNELGPGSSSPILTTSAPVTRASDVPILTGLVIPNPHTLVVEWTPGFDTGASFRRTASLNNAALSVEHTIYQRHTNDFVRGFITTDVDNLYGTGNAAAVNRAATRFALNDVNGALNGVVGTTDTTATPGTMDRLYLGLRADLGMWLNGYLRRVLIYNRAFSDAELAAATA